MKLKLILLIIFCTLKVYAQTTSSTISVYNTAKCNDLIFPGMTLNNGNYELQPHPGQMQLGYVSNGNKLSRGYCEFDLQSANIPQNATITKAVLIGKLYTASSVPAIIIVHRQDNQLSCSNVNQTGWNYLAGGTPAASLPFVGVNETERFNVLSLVNLKRNGKLILSFKDTDETTHNMSFYLERLEITYEVVAGKPPAPTNLRASRVLSTSCELKWDIQLESGSSYLFFAYSDNPNAEGWSVGSRIVVRDLQPSTIYNFYVIVLNTTTNMISERSNTIQVTTLPPISITGPDMALYYGGNAASSFTLNNAPAETITWTVTGPQFSFSVSDVTTTTTPFTSPTVRVYRRGTTAADPGTLRAIVASEIVATKTIIPCPPLMFYTSSIRTNKAPDNYYQIPLTSPSGVLQDYLNFYYWKWYVHEASGWKEQLYAETSGSPPSSASIYINGSTVYYGDVYVEIKCVGTNNSTGQTHTAYAEIKCNDCEFDGYSAKSSSLVYPNPVSDVLNVDLELATSSGALESVANGVQLKQESTYDVRLYDRQGNLLRHAIAKGGNVEFNVQSLSNGVYFLHIYDGISEKPKMQQIVVEH